MKNIYRFAIIIVHLVIKSIKNHKKFDNDLKMRFYITFYFIDLSRKYFYKIFLFKRIKYMKGNIYFTESIFGATFFL